MAIDDVVNDWNAKKVDPKYFIGHPKISLRVQDYSMTGIRAASSEFSPPPPSISTQNIPPMA